MAAAPFTPHSNLLCEAEGQVRVQRGECPWWENQNCKKKPPKTPTASVTGAEESITRTGLHCPADVLLERASTFLLHLADALSLSESLWFACTCYTQLQKGVRVKSSKPKASVGSTSLSLSATLLLAASPSSSFPHSRAGIWEETLLCNSQTDALPETHQWTETAALQLSPCSRRCVNSSPCRETGRKHPLDSAVLSPSLSSLMPAQGAESSNCSADLPQLFWLAQGRKSLRNQLAQLERKSQHPPPPSCLDILWCLLPNPMSSVLLSWDASLDFSCCGSILPTQE